MGWACFHVHPIPLRSRGTCLFLIIGGAKVVMNTFAMLSNSNSLYLQYINGYRRFVLHSASTQPLCKKSAKLGNDGPQVVKRMEQIDSNSLLCTCGPSFIFDNLRCTELNSLHLIDRCLAALHLIHRRCKGAQTMTLGSPKVLDLCTTGMLWRCRASLN